MNLFTQKSWNDNALKLQLSVKHVEKDCSDNSFNQMHIISMQNSRTSPNDAIIVAVAHPEAFSLLPRWKTNLC